LGKIILNPGGAMNIRKALLGFGILISLSGGQVFAQENSMQEITQRIKNLREKLEAFRNRDGKQNSETSSNPTPAQESENLENRKDAKVIVLYHESSNPQQEPAGELKQVSYQTKQIKDAKPKEKWFHKIKKGNYLKKG